MPPPYDKYIYLNKISIYCITYICVYYNVKMTDLLINA